MLALSTPFFVSAQAPCPPGKSGLQCAGTILDQSANTSKTGLSADLGDTVATVIKAVLALVGTIFLILTIYAGILWMTAQGNEEQVTKAVGIIKASVIGLIIIMSAYAITFFVTSKLTGATGTSSQNTPNSNQLGCCYTASTDQFTSRLESDCQGAQETWGAEPC